MKNRIKHLFANQKKNVLAVYYTAGYPSVNDTVPIALALARGGADIIEIGIPFSDPVADGPTIQQSNKVALENGMTLRILLDQVKHIRAQCDVPLVLMGYVNPILQFGVEAFSREASAAGVDGLIVPDLPMQVFERDCRQLFESKNLLSTFLVAPTTSEERIRKVDALTASFIYAVSASSTTGAKGSFTPTQIEYFARLKSMNLVNPFLTGFGIGDSEAFRVACEYGAGAIVGSAFIRHLGENGISSAGIEDFVKLLKGSR